MEPTILEQLRADLEDLKLQVSDVESKIELITKDVSCQINENITQNQQLKELIKNNRRSVKSLTLVLTGGVAALFLMLFRVDLKSEEGLKAYESFTDRIFELASLSIAGGAGYLAIREERKSKPEDEL